MSRRAANAVDDNPLGWQGAKTTLKERISYMYCKDVLADVYFTVGKDDMRQARLFDEPQLAKLCLEIIDKNTAEALNGEGFTDIDLEALCLVLARDTLRVKEAQLFQVQIVSETDLHARSVCIFHVVGCAQSGLLTDREVVNLFLYFTVNPKPSIGFNDNPRCSGAGKELVVSRFQRIEGRWGYSGTPDRIKFTVDRKIFVVGFGLYGAIHGPHEYQCVIQIIHCGTGKVLAQNDTSFVCDGSSSTCRVSFRVPVEITPGVTYIASACLK
ncbi:PHR domain protein, partial [Teladorsagia circumcincta]